VTAVTDGPDGVADLDAVVAVAVADARRRIAAVAGQRRVALLAVTKGFGPDEVCAAVRAGVDGCAENYAQELVAKADALATGGLPAPSHWHFIGQLQRNKVRQLAGLVSVWQSVDRLSLGAEIAKRSPGATAFVQVNLSQDPARGGCTFDDVPGLVTQLRTVGLTVNGLMGVAPYGPAENARPVFERLVAMADDLGLAERSIGMSGDFEVAVEAGATMVRLGTVLFGSRVKPPAD
jgi:pyridoxal phosphate enzyme (YggS family)